jgi:hypothetical protein
LAKKPAQAGFFVCLKEGGPTQAGFFVPPWIAG